MQGGFINILKPRGPRCSSLLNGAARTLAEVRGGRSDERVKAGWAGTLDPMASGVLPLAIGGATRAISLLPVGWKEYRARILIGACSTSDDADADEAWGLTDVPAQLAEAHASMVPSALAGVGSLSEAVAALCGSAVMQAPPVVSALRVGGVRSHELARAGKIDPSDLPRRLQLLGSVVVEEDVGPVSAGTLALARAALEGLSAEGWEGGAAPEGMGLRDDADGSAGGVMSWPRHRALASLLRSGALERCTEAVVTVRCSGGTFVRGVARDIGTALGSAGMLTELVRLEASGLRLADAVPEAELGAPGCVRDAVDVAVSGGAPTLTVERPTAGREGLLLRRVGEQAAWAAHAAERKGQEGADAALPCVVHGAREGWGLGTLSVPHGVLSEAVSAGGGPTALLLGGEASALEAVGERVLAGAGGSAVGMAVRAAEAQRWVTAPKAGARRRRTRR